jgi:hypothetical protein
VGQVEIFDAFGKSRGVIDINQTGNLGYVLPSSTREFDVTWQNDLNLLDIGQYTAVATFSYGDQQKKTVSRTTTFWILPIANILEILFVVFVVAGGLIIALKWFVRKMLSRELTRYGGPSIPLTPSPSKKRKWFGKPNESTKKSIPSEPHEGVIDLRKK